MRGLPPGELRIPRPAPRALLRRARPGRLRAPARVRARAAGPARAVLPPHARARPVARGAPDRRRGGSDRALDRRGGEGQLSPLADAFDGAVRAGRVGDRLWLYATYHCNLACGYCLTESFPGIANRRTLPREALLRAAGEARELGFRSLGITGGEPFLLPWLPETLAELSGILPTITLTNGTLFTDGLLARVEPLAGFDAALQISLDSDAPDRNDELRGPRNFEKVVDAVPRLVERGIRVRIATTVDGQAPDEIERLCVLHRALGVPEEDHVVRPVVRRGKAALEGMGIDLDDGVLPELTLTAEGAFLHPFAPTVRHGQTDLDLRAGAAIEPLSRALECFLEATGEPPAGSDAVRNIR